MFGQHLESSAKSQWHVWEERAALSANRALDEVQKYELKSPEWVEAVAKWVPLHVEHQRIAKLHAELRGL